MKKIFAILLILLPFVLGGCMGPKTRTVKVDEQSLEQEQEKQRELALDYFFRMNKRLANTAFPLMISSSKFCDDKKPATGLLVTSRDNFTKEFRDSVKNIYGISDQLSLLHVVPGSPADLAGLKAKDIVLTVNDKKIPAGKEAVSKYREILSEADLHRVTFGIKRNGRPMNFTLQTQAACDYIVALSERDAVNAYADGKRVIITKGMMRFAETDQELSLVISHEIAHNAMGHINAKRVNSIGGTLLDIAAAVAGVNTQGMFGRIGASAYSQAFENEADYVGLYIMARANQPIDKAELFWRRMAVEHPGNIRTNHSASHPATAARFLAIQKTSDQINRKKSLQLPLLPDMKEK